MRPATTLFFALVALVVAIGMPACRRRASSADGTVHLRFSGYVGNPAETRVMGELVGEFNTAHPGIHVTYEPIPGQYYPKLLAMLVADAAPDVFYLDILFFKPFHAKKKIMLSLEPFLAKSTTKKEDFLPPLLDAFTVEGSTYGIPKDFNALALFYNKEMFDAAGLAYPDESWDMEKLRETAKRLTKPGGPYGVVLNHDRPDRYVPVARSFGADVFGQDGHCALRSPEGIASLDFYAGMKLKDGSAIYPAEVGATFIEEAFGRRMAAMALAGSWMIGYLKESNPDVPYGLTELPRGPKGRSNILFTVSYSIAQSSPHPNEAFQLIEFLTSEASQARITWALPSRKTASTRYVDAHPEYAPVLRGADYARGYEFGPKSNRVEARLGVALQQVFLGARTSAGALEEACDEIDRITGL